MRQLVSLGLFALILSMFSSQALAASAEACDQVKKAKKGLYGLCVAWYNADEKGQAIIAAKFDARSDIPLSKIVDSQSEPPEQDFYCPCWAEISIDDILPLCKPTFSQLSDSDNVVAWFDPDPYYFFAASTTSTGCAYDSASVFPISFDDLNSDEILDCVAEIESIATSYLSNPDC